MKQLIITLYLLLLYVLVVSGQSSSASVATTLPYQFDGTFRAADPSFPFRGNLIANIKVLENIADSTTIDFIHKNTKSLPWKKTENVQPERGSVYWIKTTLQGSSLFNGEVLLHISQKMGNDLYGFGLVDAYLSDGSNGFSHQRTGDLIHLEDRPYKFWAPFVSLDLLTTDSLDLYIRLADMDRYHPLDKINLWHIDASSVFPRQLEESRIKILFYGSLGIQFLFFLCLFLIEKVRIHFHFSLLILGLFLIFAFTASNYHSYVPFPNVKAYHFFFFFLGIFITKVSLLNFVATYFNYSSNSIWNQKVIPVLITVYAVLDIVTFIKISLDSFIHSIGFFIFSIICSTSVFIVFFIMAFQAKTQYKILKRLFFVAFIPVSLASFALMNWEFIYILFKDFLVEDSIYYRIFLRDWCMMLIAFMLGVLALSIGYRTKFLKLEKENGLKQNLEDQKTILQKELEAKKLLEVNDIKTQFFTNITHEFRTPLTVIMGVNEELANTNNKPSKAKNERERIEKGHQLIERNSKNLLHLINQLLDLSKSDNNTLTVQNKQADIIPYLNYLTESFYSIANEKNIRLVFYTELKSLIMDFDENRIQQLIYNLLSNALKFTKPGDKIILHAQQTLNLNQPFLEIKVSDSGIGISKEELPKIFNRFYQVNPDRMQNTEGAGIGLALTKELVELMKGSIQADSELGVGTVISVQLPIANEAPISDNNWKLRATSSDNIRAEESIGTAEPFVNGNNKPLLLLVEDNKDIVSYVSQLLEDKYQIQTANNGATGIEKAMELIPDIIISDVMMPEKDGFELTAMLKQDPKTSHIPIILLTAKATEADKIEGLSRGADAYLMKPFNKAELMIRLEKLTGLRNALKQRYSKAHMSGTNLVDLTNSDLTAEDLFLQKLQHFVMANLSDSDLSATKLGQVVQIGASQLSRKLKALTDETPSSFVRNIRLQKGMELLKSSDLNIAEIAYQIGFKDPNYFSRTFHKAFGKSPKIFRK